ncbi:MAG: YceD family protein [Geminocystis sp.]|nr:YceD family protein [Geminocystis sp.]HIK38247.1 DUF177 domain-containing protein [Geminocystis sp. M7585_C2015_104]MCS7146640.1 YceD family protein [Geminocystis sp.]MCX8077211.1 YceD family protein [Geminocystis sp.]MDW8115466.1 YceD family protein [Geminocystis sp.]
METIHLPQLLKMPERTMVLRLCHRIAGLDTLTPVRGLFTIRHGGNFIELSLVADTIITLVCDRCLQTFNHRLSVDTSEIIYLKEEPQNPLPEREITWEELCETLPPDSEFLIEDWIYQQLCLALPLRNICSNNCSIPPYSSTGPEVDSRWSALAQLKHLLPD